jgi:nucleoside-diphosphate-sugar epimerase
MRVLVTGHAGYIGTVLTHVLQDAGHQVVGLDSNLFRGCTFGPRPPRAAGLQLDIRDVQIADLGGFGGVIHLAGLSNDPLGDLDPQLTHDINLRASLRLARLAKLAGIPRFLFASSCSMYGATSGDWIREDTPLDPLTPYAISKARVEEGLSHLADEHFSPTFLRNATAYGVSPRLRCDLVLNQLVAAACVTGQILIKSDGTAWRPLVHVEDIARAFLAVLEAPRALVHNQAFNVGSTDENHQVKDLGELVRALVPGATMGFAEGAGPDRRTYRVDCTKLATTLPAARPGWTVRRGIEQLVAAYRQWGMCAEDIDGPRYVRIGRIHELLRTRQLDPSLRWRTASGGTGSRCGISRAASPVAFNVSATAFTSNHSPPPRE